MKSNKEYGYKVCYKHHGKRKWKIYLVTNRYDCALWNIRWYENNAPPDRKTKHPIVNVTWLILPIKSFLEYKWLWRDCPF
ncbi:hypothetical protein [Anaerocaecibacter muris]|uniref:hypothetical protein n=1 Tax=Anaerocaecibacter muris TaxID=2941513 RepID=UPI003F68C075